MHKAVIARSDNASRSLRQVAPPFVDVFSTPALARRVCAHIVVCVCVCLCACEFVDVGVSECVRADCGQSC